MNLVIETDLGHDPDDFFAICYLIAAGVKIRHISICPGDPDQVALADFIRDFTEQDFTIGVSHIDRLCQCGEKDCPRKFSSGGIHHKLLKRFGRPLDRIADGEGHQLIEKACFEFDDLEALVIGPATCLAFAVKHLYAKPIKRITVQGGFLGYHQHEFPCLRLPKFEGLSWCPTFNLNGDRKAAITLAESGIPLQYVSKNVCHTIEFDRNRFSDFGGGKASCAASELFIEAATLYFQKHDAKKFHDPTAAVCHLHPEIADWVRGHMVKIEGGWGTVLDPSGHRIIADINRHLLWKHLSEFS
jgi:pyrimidine-specific ribonucleoside hydrolase